MTQKGKRANRREQILHAVRRVLGQSGYESVTMKTVAAEAGVSYGLLHYYFKSKEEMLVAAMHESVAFMLDLHGQSFARMQPGDDVALTITRDFRRLVGDSSEYFNIFLECWPLTRHTTPEMRDAGQDMFDQVIVTIRRELEKLEERGVIRPSMPLGPLTVAIVALFDGLGFQAESRPAMLDDDELWTTVADAIRPWLHADKNGG